MFRVGPHWRWRNLNILPKGPMQSRTVLTSRLLGFWFGILFGILLTIGSVKTSFASDIPVSDNANKPSIEHLRTDIETHRNRLIAVTVNVARAFPHLFPHASKQLSLVRDYMRYTHDGVKLKPLGELARYGYPYDTDVLTGLHNQYGVNEKDMSIHVRSMFQTFRDHFNRIEEEIKIQFFTSRRIALDSVLVSEIRLLEKIVDLTDTGIFRRREMGIENNQTYDGAHYLAKIGFERKWIILSMDIESSYSEFLKEPTLRSCMQVMTGLFDRWIHRSGRLSPAHP